MSRATACSDPGCAVALDRRNRSGLCRLHSRRGLVKALREDPEIEARRRSGRCSPEAQARWRASRHPHLDGLNDAQLGDYRFYRRIKRLSVTQALGLVRHGALS